MKPKVFSKRQHIPPAIDLGLKAPEFKKKTDLRQWLPFVKKAEDDNLVDLVKGQITKFGKDIFADTSSLSSLSGASFQSTETNITIPSPCFDNGAPDVMPTNEDEKQKKFICNVLEGKVYLHTLFVMNYKPLYCINRGNYGFTCIYASRNEPNALYAVKFLKKEAIPASGWVLDDGRLTPLEIIQYKEGYYKDLPVYRWHYEDSDYYYVITELRAHEKAAWEKTFLERVTNGFIGNKFHEINWNRHFQ